MKKNKNDPPFIINSSLCGDRIQNYNLRIQQWLG